MSTPSPVLSANLLCPIFMSRQFIIDGDLCVHLFFHDKSSTPWERIRISVFPGPKSVWVTRGKSRLTFICGCFHITAAKQYVSEQNNGSLVQHCLLGEKLFLFTFFFYCHTFINWHFFSDPGTAHCANMYPARSEDLPQLAMARDHIFLMLQQWLQQ